VKFLIRRTPIHIKANQAIIIQIIGHIEP